MTIKLNYEMTDAEIGFRIGEVAGRERNKLFDRGVGYDEVVLPDGSMFDFFFYDSTRASESLRDLIKIFNKKKLRHEVLQRMIDREMDRVEG